MGCTNHESNSSGAHDAVCPGCQDASVAFGAVRRCETSPTAAMRPVERRTRDRLRCEPAAPCAAVDQLQYI